MRRLLDSPGGRTFTIVVLAAWLTACYKTYAPSEPLAVVTSEKPRTLNVWMSDGSKLKIRDAQVSVIGEPPAEREILVGTVGSRTDTIPVAMIERYEVEEVDGARSGVLVGVLVGGFILTLALISAGARGGFLGN